MAEKVTKMLVKVDLQCSRCRKRIKKILCKIPQIRDQIYDEKQNAVLITVVCCSPEKIREKIICKGGETVLDVLIVPEKPKEPEKKPEKPKEPEKKPEKPKEPEKPKDPRNRRSLRRNPRRNPRSRRSRRNPRSPRSPSRPRRLHSLPCRHQRRVTHQCRCRRIRWCAGVHVMEAMVGDHVPVRGRGGR
ncbi:hypothetical protein BT93_E2832 [Corymbia citriodora subsp. variegata]|nr:hypothetical protein BT93_E2832 [Corymbia citriodora subsp. variegata]